MSWLKRLYDPNDHPWKLIPRYYFRKISRSHNTIFYPNLRINHEVLNEMPLFYKNLVIYWEDFSQCEPITTSSVLSESIWNNSHIKINFNTLQPSFFGISQHIFVKDLLDDNGNFISWNIFSHKFNIQYSRFFKWVQLKSCIPKKWLKLVKSGISDSICDFKPHINIKSRICSIDKLTSSFIYKQLVTSIEKPPTSQSFFNAQFDISHLWKSIYLLPRYTTVDTYSRMFQYKILNNMLFLNDKLFRLHLVDDPLCSLCSLANENIQHLFFECSVSQGFWKSLQNHFRNHLVLNNLILQSAVFVFLDDPVDILNITNHILLIFKIFLYKYRTKNPTFSLLLARIKNTANIESHLCHTVNHRVRHNSKWGNIIDIL